MLIEAIIGFLVLFFGKRLFWLFVGAVGFAVGAELAAGLFPDWPWFFSLCVALLCGVLSVIAVMYTQKMAIIIAGFLTGAFVAFWLLFSLGLQAGALLWVTSIAFGVLGGMLLLIMFDVGLIFLSCLIGAYLMSEWLRQTPYLQMPLFLVLFIAGFLTQMYQLTKPRMR